MSKEHKAKEWVIGLLLYTSHSRQRVAEALSMSSNVVWTLQCFEKHADQRALQRPRWKPATTRPYIHRLAISVRNSTRRGLIFRQPLVGIQTARQTDNIQYIKICLQRKFSQMNSQVLPGLGMTGLI